MFDIISINQNHLQFDYLTLFLVIFAGIQVYIQNRQKDISLYQQRFSHTQNLQKVIENFYEITPNHWDDKIKKHVLEIDNYNTSNDTYIKWQKIHFDLDILVKEAKYLFNLKVYEFEKKFYEIFLKFKEVFKNEDKKVYLESLQDDINLLINEISSREKYFDKDLSISTTLIEKIKRKLLKNKVR